MWEFSLCYWEAFGSKNLERREKQVKGPEGSFQLQQLFLFERVSVVISCLQTLPSKNHRDAFVGKISAWNSLALLSL